MTDEKTEPSDDLGAEAPPLGSWTRLYAVVLGVLVVEIVLFAVFTKVFE